MKRFFFMALCVWQVAGYAGNKDHNPLVSPTDMEEKAKASANEMNRLAREYPGVVKFGLAAFEKAKENPVPAAVIGVGIVGGAAFLAYKATTTALMATIGWAGGMVVGTLIDEVRKRYPGTEWTLSPEMRGMGGEFLNGFSVAFALSLGYKVGGVGGLSGAGVGYVMAAHPSSQDLKTAFKNCMQLNATAVDRARLAGFVLGGVAGGVLGVKVGRFAKS